MLVLSRKPGQQIAVIAPSGDVLTIKVVSQESTGDVKIGITAPREYEILRTEIIGRDRRGA